MENLLCNTPIIGFDVSAVPELIKHKKNGYLAKLKDAEDLANGIKYLIENRNVLNIDANYSSNRVIERHFDVWNEIMHTKRK